MSCHGMSISFNVLCYLLNMQRAGGRGYISSPGPLDLSFWLQSIMHVRGALRVACYHLLLLGVFGKHNNHHGTRNMSPHPSRLDRSHRHHLPTYMMHLYRHFKLNQTRPVENMEHEQADTIKSILSKSKIWHFYHSHSCLKGVIFTFKDGNLHAHRGENISQVFCWGSLWLLAVKSQRQTPWIHISLAAE